VNAVVLIVLRGLAGGALVVLFALLAETLLSKAFAGLFSAAPSVAFASLALTVGFESVAKAQTEATGMVLGGIGMVASCAFAAVAIPRLKAIWGSLVAWVTWAMISLGLYWAVFVGAR
jgi:hypothetical protein